MVEDFKEILGDIFGEIIRKYKFNFITVNNYAYFLIGKGFSISITISLEGSRIYYIVPTENGDLIEYWFDNFICSKFDAQDREKFGKPSTNYERIVAELRVTASGLLNHWDNMLKGSKSWIEEYKKYKFGGDARKASEFDTKLLKPIFEKQI